MCICVRVCVQETPAAQALLGAAAAQQELPSGPGIEPVAQRVIGAPRVHGPPLLAIGAGQIVRAGGVPRTVSCMVALVVRDILHAQVWCSGLEWGGMVDECCLDLHQVTS